MLFFPSSRRGKNKSIKINGQSIEKGNRDGITDSLSISVAAGLKESDARNKGSKRCWLMILVIRSMEDSHNGRCKMLL